MVCTVGMLERSWFLVMVGTVGMFGGSWFLILFFYGWYVRRVVVSPSLVSYIVLLWLVCSEGRGFLYCSFMVSMLGGSWFLLRWFLILFFYSVSYDPSIFIDLFFKVPVKETKLMKYVP